MDSELSSRCAIEDILSDANGRVVGYEKLRGIAFLRQAIGFDSKTSLYTTFVSDSDEVDDFYRELSLLEANDLVRITAEVAAWGGRYRTFTLLEKSPSFFASRDVDKDPDAMNRRVRFTQALVAASSITVWLLSRYAYGLHLNRPGETSWERISQRYRDESRQHLSDAISLHDKLLEIIRLPSFGPFSGV